MQLILAAILSLLTHSTVACLGHVLSKRVIDPTTGLNVTIGDSSPQPPATVGYNLNHFAITVSNLTATLDFYTNALGFRHIFTAPVDDKHSITYLGYPSGGRNGTGYQTAEEMARDMRNSEGLIEILESKSSDNYSDPVPTHGVGFSHLGFVVPNANDTQTRLEAWGAKILKRLGEPFTKTAVSYYFGLPESQFSEQQYTSFRGLFLDFLLVLDPSGFLLEIQSQY
ncbi:MAG: hypothetical protein M1820_010255 [Bogoriella megaspora]|nr:MAG: hypothetical protein M1820_010255 [Bogoriella megaspora]